MTSSATRPSSTTATASTLGRYRPACRNPRQRRRFLQRRRDGRLYRRLRGNKPGTLKVKTATVAIMCATLSMSLTIGGTPLMTFSGRDKHTHIDVYGFYPLPTLSIEDYQFEVQKTRARLPRMAKWVATKRAIFSGAKVSDVAPTGSVIRLPMAHRMSNARVALIPGFRFCRGQMGESGEDCSDNSSSPQGKASTFLLAKSRLQVL